MALAGSVQPSRSSPARASVPAGPERPEAAVQVASVVQDDDRAAPRRRSRRAGRRRVADAVLDGPGRRPAREDVEVAERAASSPRADDRREVGGGRPRARAPALEVDARVVLGGDRQLDPLAGDASASARRASRRRGRRRWRVWTCGVHRRPPLGVDLAADRQAVRRRRRPSRSDATARGQRRTRSRGRRGSRTARGERAAGRRRWRCRRRRAGPRGRVAHGAERYQGAARVGDGDAARDAVPGGRFVHRRRRSPRRSALGRGADRRAGPHPRTRRPVAAARPRSAARWRRPAASRVGWPRRCACRHPLAGDARSGGVQPDAPVAASGRGVGGCSVRSLLAVRRGGELEHQRGPFRHGGMVVPLARVADPQVVHPLREDQHPGGPAGTATAAPSSADGRRAGPASSPNYDSAGVGCGRRRS